jgi:hypothetical protein
MEEAERQVRQWLEQVVIGLNLCPFAAAPYRNGLVRISVSHASTEATLLAHLHSELMLIDESPATTVDTTLLVIVGLLTDFDAYNDFLAEVNNLLRTGGWEGKYQVASFHPRYRFRGTRDDDACTGLIAPWPILHILRGGVSTGLSGYSEPAEHRSRILDDAVGESGGETRLLHRLSETPSSIRHAVAACARVPAPVTSPLRQHPRQHKPIPPQKSRSPSALPQHAPGAFPEIQRHQRGFAG